MSWRRASVVVSVVVVAAALVAGCGDDDGPTIDHDAGTDAGEPPPAAAMPVLTPCPSGWREVISPTGVTTCDPWPATGQATCAADEAHFPGEPGCVRIGSACPTTGDLPEGLPTDRPVFYALASAAGGGDGSLTRPFNRIRDAFVRAVAVRGIVAIGRGRYDEALNVRGGVTLWGACVAETEIHSSVPDDTLGVVDLALPGRVEVRNLTIGRSERPSVQAFGGGAVVALEDVVIREGVGRGVWASEGGRIEASSMLLEGTRLNGTAFLGRGLVVLAGASASVTRAVISGNHDTGAVAADEGGPAATLELADVAIVDTMTVAPPRLAGIGLAVIGGSTVNVARTVIERNRVVGIIVQYGRATLVAEDLVVRDNLGADVTGDWGHALEASYDVSVTLRRTLIERTRSIGISLSDVGTTGTLEDVVIRDIAPRVSDGRWGVGVNVWRSGTIDASRLFVERTRRSAVIAGTSATFRGTDIRITGVQREACPIEDCFPDRGAHGLVATSSATVTANHLIVRDAQVCGAMVAAGAQMDLADGEIAGSEIGACVQVDDYAFDRLATRVRYHDNGTSVQATTLPVPETLTGL